MLLNSLVHLFLDIGEFFLQTESPKVVVHNLQKEQFQRAVNRASRKLQRRAELERLLVRYWGNIHAENIKMEAVYLVGSKKFNANFVSLKLFSFLIFLSYSNCLL